ncbi:F0F1 ATP synthase subunit epsilon [Vibrio sp. 10N.222.54.F12]|uniref:ATP synthase epsilon chain n=1 Tax=Vibrio tasmaniensis 1F-267 TaxID=1191324 RepID=A0ABX3BGD9_9VIBR|nr:F0F1 ATP synthase subunit epsilon [Vibrio tasmaniensis]OEF59266.1 F0F1 ATP synthase subunit epsilon [Vibrio tasmaniensis 1F-267]PML17764.1 F0F1 ATP synthase subunit epsilon [Vibrio tasmaniensis]PML43333.1 F0F1 ATP synthase subunit epsilon [Vibrio tasmaniensis]
MAIGITDNTFQLNIVSAEGTLFSGPAYALAVSGADGELGIRPGHSPLLSKIKPGVTVFVTDPKSEGQVLYVSGGMLEVQPDVVTVLADTALHGQDIDRARAEEAKYAALENINKGNIDINFAQAQLELAKAVAQLRASELTSSHTRH